MFSVTVRDRIMVAHSLPGDFFGPAQRLHGATYVVDVTVRSEELESHGVVVDIGALSRELRGVLSAMEYRNLDELPEFEGVSTTTEVIARAIADQLAGRFSTGAVGDETDHLRDLEVTLRESDIARAGYRRGL